MISTVCSILLLLPAVDVVVPRGGGDPIECVVSRVDADGVRMSRGEEASKVLSWDRVADVRLDDDRVPRLPELLERGEQLWRARSRLERGDVELAEPVFELLFPETVGRTSETALVVSEGLLRCRLMRGELDAALLPAMEVARLRRAGIRTTSYRMLQPPSIEGGGSGLIRLWDEDTALCPYLPPAWLQGPGLQPRVVELEQWDSGGDAALAAVADLYARSIRQELGEPVEPADLAAEGIGDEPGVVLLAASLNAVHADPAVRAAARSHIQSRYIDDGSWQESWGRHQLGRSLLMEEGTGQQRRGLLSLSHVPARWDRAQPYLSGLSMAIMARHFESMGDDDAAHRLRTDLRRLHPGHPVLRRGLQDRPRTENKEDS